MEKLEIYFMLLHVTTIIEWANALVPPTPFQGRLANGRLEGPNKRGLCAGKGQAAMLERWRPEGLVVAAARDLERFKGF